MKKINYYNLLPIINFGIIEMEQIIDECFKTQNWTLLVQLFQTKTQFMEIKYAIGTEDFQQFVRCFQIIYYDCAEGLFQIFSGYMYYFVSGGFIVKKNQRQSETKNKRNLYSRKGVFYSEPKPYNTAAPIGKGQMTSVQQLLKNETKPKGFYYSNLTISTILKINQSKIPTKICQNLKAYYSQKLKFIQKISLFLTLPKQIIQENLNRFKFIKIGFNQILYSQNIRQSSIFVLVKGQVIIESGKKLQSIIINAPNLLADQKINNSQQARCLTQFCIFYGIENEDIQNIFKKNAEIDTKQYTGIFHTTQAFLRANYLQKNDQQNQNQLRYSLPQNQRNKKYSKQAISTNKHRKVYVIQDTNKNQRIKQLFSDSMNKKYAEYSQKALKNLASYKQTPILYELKSLMPYSPNYKQIHQRLKEVRLQKILNSKQKNKSSSTQSILMLKRQYLSNGNKNNTFQDKIKDAADRKILKKLQQKMAFEINKKHRQRRMKIL